MSVQVVQLLQPRVGAGSLHAWAGAQRLLVRVRLDQNSRWTQIVSLRQVC